MCKEMPVIQVNKAVDPKRITAYYNATIVDANSAIVGLAPDLKQRYFTLIQKVSMYVCNECMYEQVYQVFRLNQFILLFVNFFQTKLFEESARKSFVKFGNVRSTKK
jgi:hypothetical protein